MTSIIAYLGPAPCEEECAQSGNGGFSELNRLECRVFINQLNRQFPVPAELAGKVEYDIKLESHDFGNYREVVIRGWYNIPGVAEFSSRVEENAPAHWDEIAQQEMSDGLSKLAGLSR